MKSNCFGVVLAAALTVAATNALAAPTDYRFDPAVATVERGIAVRMKVEIRDIKKNQPVANVEIRDVRVDKSPDGNPDEKHPAFFEPSLDMGVYSFRGDLPTDGNWALTFTAKISGEAQPVPATVIFKVVGPGLSTPPKVGTTTGAAPQR